MGLGEPQHRARADRSADVIPPLSDSKMPWRVVAMTVADDRALLVRFVDGTEGTVRFGQGFYRGVFAHLLDPEAFAQVRLEMGAVTWPGELDLAPDRMHQDIKKYGECVLN